MYVANGITEAVAYKYNNHTMEDSSAVSIRNIIMFNNNNNNNNNNNGTLAGSYVDTAATGAGLVADQAADRQPNTPISEHSMFSAGVG